MEDKYEISGKGVARQICRGQGLIAPATRASRQRREPRGGFDVGSPSFYTIYTFCTAKIQPENLCVLCVSRLSRGALRLLRSSLRSPNLIASRQAHPARLGRVPTGCGHPQGAVTRLCVKINPHGTIGIMFPIDGERGFMVLNVRSPELNSVATEVRTGVMKAVG